MDNLELITITSNLKNIVSKTSQILPTMQQQDVQQKNKGIKPHG